MKASKLSFIAALASLLALGAPLAKATSIYTAGHGDLGIEYEAGSTEFEPHWHLHTGAVVNGSPLVEDTEFEPDALISRTSATYTAPAGSTTWLGVTTGSTIYRLGSETYEPELGFGFEELNASDWQNSTITVTLSGWALDNAGDVALLSGSSSSATVLASTFDPGSSANGNSWDIDLGVGHEHPVWLFSALGNYGLEFTWSGTYIGEGAEVGGTLVSGSGVFTFEAAAIPEPATCAALFGAAVLGLVIWQRRRVRG